jgi:hypothetical protein
LSGKHHGLLDVPGIPDRLKQKLSFEVWNYKKYRDRDHQDNRFCEGDDDVSFTIYTQGVWEPFQTLLFLDVLSRGDRSNLVLDYGANMGWYSVLSGLSGYATLAFEGNMQIYQLLGSNIIRNNLTNVFTCGTIIDEATPKFSAEYEEVEFMKCDIEGAEIYAVNMCDELFKARKVKYAQLEISPCFNDTYPDLVERIAECGYFVYIIPKKGDERAEEFGQQPLETLKKYYQLNAEGRREFVKSVSQDDFIFIRSDLV